ncbi:MAG TPA: copper chaperone [Caldithrix abyssi]|uniref:Copper chaperone n=1 Tax=Caldithrix abyssi TaxID=187145 RepID=A0A7V4U0D9_CALAY|nr:copper chaperone [Caldithrix abyssi]
MQKYIAKWITAIVLFTVLSLPFTVQAQDTKKETKDKEKEKITLQVDGLSCPFCAYGLEKKLKSIEGINQTDIELNKGVVTLEVSPNAAVDSLLLKEKINEAGFTLKKFKNNSKEKTKQPENEKK